MSKIISKVNINLRGIGAPVAMHAAAASKKCHNCNCDIINTDYDWLGVLMTIFLVIIFIFYIISNRDE
jgi:hypothetical protein